MQSRIETFKRNGFAIFLRAIGDAVLDQCRRHLREFQKAYPEQWRLGGIIELNPSLAITLSTHSEVLDFAECIMGPFVQLDRLTIVGLGPMVAASVQAKVSGWRSKQEARPALRVQLRPSPEMFRGSPKSSDKCSPRP